jgi:hypothetical protein
VSTFGRVTKLMYAVWGSDVASGLKDPAWHQALAATGVERLQLNLDDDDVAAAMRIPTFAEPITAVVSTWLAEGAEPDGPSSLLGEVADRHHGWLVDERRPIGPAESWDGSRADTLANVAVIRRPESMTEEEWLHRWLVDHTPIAIETQATFGYLQNIVVDPVTDRTPFVSAFVEELFPSEAITDMHAFYGSGGDDAELNDRLTRLMASVARIGADRDLDLVPTSRYLFQLS